MDIKNLSIEELKNCIISRKIILSNGEERKFDLIDFYLMSEKKTYFIFKNGKADNWLFRIC